MECCTGNDHFNYQCLCILSLYQGVIHFQHRSIAVVDNLKIHLADEVISLFEQDGILVLFLPPYSPDSNPAEELFSYVKSYLCEHDSILQVIPDSSHCMHIHNCYLKCHYIFNDGLLNVFILLLRNYTLLQLRYIKDWVLP